MMREAKIDKILLGENPGPFSAPGGRSRQSKTGILQETPVRTLWDYSWALNLSTVVPKPRKLNMFQVNDRKLLGTNNYHFSGQVALAGGTSTGPLIPIDTTNETTEAAPPWTAPHECKHERCSNHSEKVSVSWPGVWI